MQSLYATPSSGDAPQRPDPLCGNDICQNALKTSIKQVVIDNFKPPEGEQFCFPWSYRSSGLGKTKTL